MSDLSGQTALVTGSARGIGRAIAVRYAALGAQVVVNYHSDTAAAHATVAQIEAAGGRAVAVQGDVAVSADLDRLFATTLEHYGRLDVVVANAGREVISQPVIDVADADFDALVAVNVRGAFFTLQRGAKLVADGGRLIYIGSSTTVSPHPGTGLYSASKVFAQQLVRVLAMELGARDVKVNTILPTATAGAGVFTDVVEGDEFHRVNAKIRPLGGRGGTPEDAADAAEYLASPLARWVSGQSLLIAGGAVQ
ncbi:3-oxoacyl-[acyl-carrier protein] reductase [Kineococcus radiotolerans]|uniref:3-oxoacyl-[acyl-carrier protein] reductase n=1 Tax=Kineococcus radiotolerans TaxID=131568 RepID=A0A7W4TR61_KINRA|nr:SDR family oxidoreductase [Kineococcus radiotolerans]MBB2903208.1 3-oxoacyl-[acyl-carrier protein] reductase [Kineococcus radiotolerans]